MTSPMREKFTYVFSFWKESSIRDSVGTYVPFESRIELFFIFQGGDSREQVDEKRIF